jgi:GNAT superfamily N-acetyltransferase
MVALIRRLTAEDIPACAEVSDSIGWGRRMGSWHYMIALGGEGALGMVVDGRVVATAFGLIYSPALAWIGTVITHHAHQGKGYARQLMVVLMDYLCGAGVQSVMLDATEFGQPLYASLGFRPLYRVNIYGATQEFNLTQSPARPYRAEHLPQIVALDQAVMGVERPAVLAEMAERGWVRLAQAGDRVAGYCLAQGDEALMHLGPWWDESTAGAELLLQTALASMPGTAVRINVPLPHAEAVALVERNGLFCLRGCTRMVWGEPPPGHMTAQYGIASYGTG